MSDRLKNTARNSSRSICGISGIFGFMIMFKDITSEELK